MRTTIVVSVTLKVDAEGDTVDALIRDATERAHAFVDGALEGRSPAARSITLEGSTALVNREAFEV